jgi:hypothetical protein
MKTTAAAALGVYGILATATLLLVSNGWSLSRSAPDTESETAVSSKFMPSTPKAKSIKPPVRLAPPVVAVEVALPPTIIKRRPKPLVRSAAIDYSTKLLVTHQATATKKRIKIAIREPRRFQDLIVAKAMPPPPMARPLPSIPKDARVNRQTGTAPATVMNKPPLPPASVEYISRRGEPARIIYQPSSWNAPNESNSDLSTVERDPETGRVTYRPKDFAAYPTPESHHRYSRRPRGWR